MSSFRSWIRFYSFSHFHLFTKSLTYSKVVMILRININDIYWEITMWQAHVNVIPCPGPTSELNLSFPMILGMLPTQDSGSVPLWPLLLDEKNSFDQDKPLFLGTSCTQWWQRSLKLKLLLKPSSPSAQICFHPLPWASFPGVLAT